MKKKSQKFQLAKETIRRLNLASLEEAVGGDTTDLFESRGCWPYPSWSPCGASAGWRCY